jgi:hypothetical protein
MSAALSGAAWASLGAGVLVALVIVGAVVFTARYGRREKLPTRVVLPEEDPLPAEQPAERPEQESRPPVPPPLDTAMIRWDRVLPPVPPPKERPERGREL